MSQFEVAHLSALIPALVLTALWATGRRAPGAYWWVASGLAVSIFGDSLQKLAGGGFGVTFYYTPLQIGLVLCAFQPGLIPRALLLAFLAVAGWVSAHATTQPAEWMVTVCGSAVIAAAAFHGGRLRAPLWTYFLAGTLAYVWMIPTIVPPGSPMHPEFMFRWGLYQTMRWVAFALFAFDVYRNREGRAWTS